MSTLRWEAATTIGRLREAGGLMACEIDRFKIALYEVGAAVYATADLCTHGGARLSQGYLEEFVIECPLHQGRFDIRTGAVTAPPCKRPVRVFPVRIEGQEVLVGIPATIGEIG
jgi:naphthalene 1,2-dioxygenase system ferredoxin subunit